MEAQLMTLRCDHCRGKLGTIVHRYWRMRFCSAACAQTYEQRLRADTRAKIRLLNRTSRENLPPREARSPAGRQQHFAA